ncbi:serine/threonine-protein phosphatase 7 long form homolog [Apium graveolens]|uniref:serine/threonine-protein phosphatase 7 long form homolog n=1 Tax=Apium graveolens TaxID=4045 RepID=UPI003D7989A5
MVLLSNVPDDTFLDDFELHPGPTDPSVLYLQAEHRSTNVWKAGGGDSQRTRVRCKFPALHSRLVPILRKLRFDGIASLAGITIDWSLITALVERWSPETHTFHLPTGECTITLQEVTVLLGLRIDGNAITGSTHAEGGWKDHIKNMFGKAPDSKSQALVGSRIKLSWLDLAVPEVLADDAEERELVRYTQAYLLQLLGGVLFTDHQGSQVHCIFIPLLQDLDRCATLSWGSGVLAFLYRELCKSCKIDVEEMAGCVLLVQLWAWTRLPTLAPIPSPPPMDIWGDLAGPYALRWCGPKSYVDVSSHVVCVHRLSLDVLVPLQFIWMPYTDVLDTLDEHCRKGYPSSCC